MTADGAAAPDGAVVVSDCASVIAAASSGYAERTAWSKSHAGLWLDVDVEERLLGLRKVRAHQRWEEARRGDAEERADYWGNAAVDELAKRMAGEALQDGAEECVEERKAAVRFLRKAAGRLSRWQPAGELFKDCLKAPASCVAAASDLGGGGGSRGGVRQATHHVFVAVDGGGGSSACGGGSCGAAAAKHCRFMCVACLCVARTHSSATRMAHRPCRPVDGRASKALVRAAIAGHVLCRVLLDDGEVVFLCRSCGAYAACRFVGLVRPCGGRSHRAKGGKSAIRAFLGRGLHPRKGTRVVEITKLQPPVQLQPHAWAADCLFGAAADAVNRPPPSGGDRSDSD